MIYAIQVYNFISQVVPSKLKKNNFLSLLSCFLEPAQVLNDDFVSTLEDTRSKANQTGQVIYLEKLLNDEFDALQRRIVIQDGQPNILPPFIYTKQEQRPLELRTKSENNPMYIYSKSEFNTNADFVVLLPATVYAQVNQRNAAEKLILNYKQAGKTFEIQQI